MSIINHGAYETHEAHQRTFLNRLASHVGSSKLPKHQKPEIHFHGYIYVPVQHSSQHLNSSQPIHPTPTIPSTLHSSARIPTRRTILVLIINSVPTITDHASRGHSLLLHALDSGFGGVVLGSDFAVEAGVRGGLVEGGDFGDVLAVGLAGVLDGLVGGWVLVGVGCRAGDG